MSRTTHVGALNRKMAEVKPIDVKSLLSSNKRAYDFISDGTHFGRGTIYISHHDKLQHSYRVSVLKRWKVNENEDTLQAIPEDVIEHFYNNECYIVYVKYQVVTTDLNTGEVRRDENGEDTKEVYFYWKGERAEKGYSPLPKELNAEDVPVERITQWAELPVFLRLFNGKLIVHKGRTTSKDFNKEPHLYILHGSVEEEVHFIEVPTEKRSLRSRTSFLLVCPDKNQIFVWHGSKAHDNNKGFCKNIVLSLKEKASSIYGTDVKSFQLTEVNEKQNDGEFLSYLYGDGEDYFMLLKDSLFTYQHSPRLFYLNSIIGEFSACEIQYSLGNEYLNPFPFLQEHLYSAPQPALFLLDNNHELWVWQGWKTETTTDDQLAVFENERLCAIQTVIEYWKQKYSTLQENIYLVTAGKEPVEFTNLFPFWEPKEEMQKFEIKFVNSDHFDNVKFMS